MILINIGVRFTVQERELYASTPIAALRGEVRTIFISRWAADKAKSIGISWSGAKVAPEKLPEALVEVPVWVPGVLFGLVALLVIVLLRNRRKAA